MMHIYMHSCIYTETSGLTENFGESFLKSYEDLIGLH